MRLSGRKAEGMRAMQGLLDNTETSLAATLAMIHAHKHSDLVYRDAIAALEVRACLCLVMAC